MWAEWSAATGGAIDPASERRRVWELDLTDLPVLDLRQPSVASALGITLDELTGPRQAAHSLAVRARELGASGLVVPSAARTGHWNVVVFPDGFDAVQIRGSRAVRPRPPG